MQAAVTAGSILRVSLFDPEVSTSNISPLCTILPAEPKEQEAAFAATGASIQKKRKLPPGIAAPEIKQPSKSLEILLNSGLRNPVLVNFQLNLTFKHGFYGILAALFRCCIETNDNLHLL